MRCALVNQTTNIVENIIVADPTVDPAPSGYIIIVIPDDSPIYIGWVYNPATGEFTPPAEPVIEGGV